MTFRRSLVIPKSTKLTLKMASSSNGIVINNRTFLKYNLTLIIAMLYISIPQIKCHPEFSEEQFETFTSYETANPVLSSFTEIPGGFLGPGSEPRRLVKSGSPYLLRDDLIIERGAELLIEPGVEVRFSPMIGITVRGKFEAVGTEEERIVFTSSEEGETKFSEAVIRLVDGPAPWAGRLQVKHNDNWRSVCSNSRNWTIQDLEIACRQLGFQGGRFLKWFDREPGFRPRLLLEEPRCRGTETSLLDCQWGSRQLGAGVCDYHGDLGLECAPWHENVRGAQTTRHWRGLRFEYANYERILTQQNTLYVPTSLSELSYVDIKHAGTGRNQNTTSSLEVLGIPPKLNHINIVHSSFNGINITDSNGPILINNCDVRNNRGYGILVNSSYGNVHVNNCTIFGNGADGIRFITHEVDPDEKHDRSDINDFCTLPTTTSQTYPIQISVDQSKYSNAEKDCGKYFTTKYGHVLTLNFIHFMTDRNESSSLYVYDGTSINDKLLGAFKIRNNTRPQSVTTTRNKIYIRFQSETRTQVLGFMRVTAGYNKAFDLNVSYSDIADNNGKGIGIENLRSQIHIYKSSISNNNHVAGLHVLSGVGDVNVTESRISFNTGDGINITYTGGNRNISRSSLSSNKGYGLAVWLNHTKETEYIHFNQTTTVQFSEIYKNLEVGVLHGNYCGDSWVNITGNSFNGSTDNALEVITCWKNEQNGTKLYLQIGHNIFDQNRKLSVKLYNAFNLEGKIEYNHIKNGLNGGVLVKNQLLEEFSILPTKILLQYNEMYTNKGVFVVNLGLSPYSDVQKIVFTRNFVRENRIREPFENEDGASFNLNPRSQVAAPIVISSSNVDIFRNIVENPESKYEIGSHFEDQSKILNCTYNWLGSRDEEIIFNRLFHRKDRYNLAKIIYLPYILHNSNPGANTIIAIPTFVPQFNSLGSNVVGGEVDGQENLKPGEYFVERDINVRPGGKLTLQPGVKLNFPPSVGMMVAGRLEARGRFWNDITFTLKQEPIMMPENDTYETDTEHYDSETQIVEVESKIPIRLLGGKSAKEGRLQVKIDNEWGTVCNYGWNMINAALVCHQLGLVLNPDDWNMERSEIPNAGTTENIILANVKCDVFDVDITGCKSEKAQDFENSCTHEHDVGIKCYESNWAGLRLGVLAERSDLQFITIEKAGLLDYATNMFKPALQIDFARHSLESIRVTDNLQDGLGVLYSDIFSAEAVNTVKNSEFSNNKGSGISFKQLGLKVQGATIENNLVGIKHNPVLSGPQQRELAGWFNMAPDFNTQESNYNPIIIPHQHYNIDLETGQTRYIITEKVAGDNVQRSYNIRCQPRYVIGIQLLNPIENRSTEVIWIYDSQNINIKSTQWLVNRDLSVFPATSSSFGIVLNYESGNNALGGTVIVLSTIEAPVQNIVNRIIKGPVPTLSVYNSKIRRNMQGIQASYYNRYLNELGDLFLRKANETIKIVNCDLSHNENEAIYIYSPFWDVHESNISEVTISINDSLITDNGKGIVHFSRDLRNSNNLFHYILQDNSIERNMAGGFEVSLPYVWDYNENFTHSVYMNNNTWRHNQKYSFVIDGHFARVNITNNVFTDNTCKIGLISMRGMEKKMKIDRNKIERNNGKYMIEFRADSQSEILGEVKAVFEYNEVRQNKYMNLMRGGMHQMFKDPTCVVGFSGIQKVNVNKNLFSANLLDYDVLAGIKTAKINNLLNVTENWWGSSDAKQIHKRIFDFDDWNNHAVAQFRPFLLEDSFDASLSVTFEDPAVVDLDNLGGRLWEDLMLYRRDTPYVIKSDITVMPQVTLTIYPGVVLEFAPNIGMLVLGTLKAQGARDAEIVMQPLVLSNHFENKVDRRSMRIIEFDANGIQKSKIIERNSNAEDMDDIFYTETFITNALDKSSKLIENTTESSVSRSKRSIETMIVHDTIRLCTGRNCSSEYDHEPEANQGFLEYYNRTTLQWVPMCDDRFTERNAQVVCRELGFDPINVFFDHDRRIEYHSNSLSRIWSWPEPLQCKGTELRYDDCPIRLNGQLYGHRHECKWDSQFVFIHCGQRNLDQPADYWGGIRFANPEFEHQLHEHRIHDIHTHNTLKRIESALEFVKIVGAGILHNEKSPAVQAIIKSPSITFVNITKSASHGINLVTPSSTMNVLFNNIHDTLGEGINAITLTGEGRESDESSFTPLKDLNLPYNLFSVIDICDTAKEIVIEERVLVYYKYDNNPVNCVKIFRSAYNVKPFGFRLLQFNLFNNTRSYGRRDSITLYEGDIYNVSSIIIGKVEMGDSLEKRLFKTKGPRLSMQLFASGASGVYGFIAEVVTLPISAIGFNRDAQHNITHCTISKCLGGAISYHAVGEVSPLLTLERNQFTDNCIKLYGNFSTCQGAVKLDVQNMQSMYFRNNLVQNNQGGLWVRADSRGSATSLRGWIHHNLFVENTNLPALYIEGRQSSPYQEVTIYRNYFTRNKMQYRDVIALLQVVSNFSYNYVHSNIGARIMDVSGFDKVRLPIYQTTTHNGFYSNIAVDPLGRSTIVAGTAGQHYVDNIFFNPDNDYEMITVNRSIFETNFFNSTLDIWKTKIDASYNYWGYNTTLAVGSRIRDRTDIPSLLEVQYRPLHMSNSSVLDGKCPPGWALYSDTCYMYIGAPMGYYEAREFCRADNASMPYLRGDTYRLYQFIQAQQSGQQSSSSFSERVWVQDLDRVDQCTAFIYQSVQVMNCATQNPFLCEIDPKVLIDPLSWKDDVVAIAVIGSLGIAVLLLAMAIGCWYSKSRHRHVQRLQRRNSIRQSLNSVRSMNSLVDPGSLRRKHMHTARSNDTLTKSSDYKKMLTNGSIDSMDKSAFSSSLEDNQSYDIYEAHNPQLSTYTSATTEYTSTKQQLPLSTMYGGKTSNDYAKNPKAFNGNSHEYSKPKYAEPLPANQSFDLSYKNEGFRDNSTFSSTRNPSLNTVLSEETPIIHQNDDSSDKAGLSDYYNNAATLPLHSTIDKSDEALNEYTDPFLKELKNKLPEYERYPSSGSTFKGPIDKSYYENGLPPPPKPPTYMQINLTYKKPTYTTSQVPQPGDSSYDSKIQNLQFTPENTFDKYGQTYQNTFNSPSTSAVRAPQTGVQNIPELGTENNYQVPHRDRPQSTAILDSEVPPTVIKPAIRSKSEALLETNFDLMDEDEFTFNEPLSKDNRSHSQPLETAM